MFSVEQIDQRRPDHIEAVVPRHDKERQAGVQQARERQARRFKDRRRITLNSDMGARELDECVKLSSGVKTLLDRSAKQLNLSARSYHRLMKLARTIADLADSDEIRIEHLAEAIQYRSLDREGWAG